jgi:peptidoglycan/LPS O-acetylase OafA/YrhL
LQGLIPHFRALDGWRGLCALIVALYHFPGSGVLEQNRIVGNAEFFVDFFFVLSGFVIAANYLHRIPDEPAALRFMGLRVGRLYPLHLVTFFAFFAFECLQAVAAGFTNAFNETNSLVTIPSTLLMIQSWGLHDHLSWNWPSWSISCEMAAYGAFALITLFYSGRARFLALAAVGCTVFVNLGLWRVAVLCRIFRRRVFLEGLVDPVPARGGFAQACDDRLGSSRGVSRLWLCLAEWRRASSSICRALRLRNHSLRVQF